MKSSLSAAWAVALLIPCSTDTPLTRRPDSSKVSESERYFWIEGFERPLNLLRVEDARELHAVWSRALEPHASLPKHVPPYLEPNEEVSSKDLRQALEFMLPKLEHALGRAQAGEFRYDDLGELLQVAEVHRALELKFKDPVRRKQSVEVALVKKLTALGAHRMLQGKHPAINAQGADDPANSSFWTRPRDISKLDLRIGFDRKVTLATEVRNQVADSVTSKKFFTGVKIVNYRTLEPNRAFEEATNDDLRWGASWLNRISDQQIHDAAIGAGFDEVRANVIVQKLHSRLYNMNKHLK